jgi:hypothetical protein
VRGYIPQRTADTTTELCEFASAAAYGQKHAAAVDPVARDCPRQRSATEPAMNAIASDQRRRAPDHPRRRKKALPKFRLGGSARGS